MAWWGEIADVNLALYKVIDMARNTGGRSAMSYLIYMAIRILEMHRILKNTGSIYLHCDSTMSHYLKMTMDAIFGFRNFRTEIVWKRTSAHSDTKQGRKQHGRIHDILLFYSKTDEITWNPVYVPYDNKYIEEVYKYVEPETGRQYSSSPVTGPGGASKGNPKYEVMGVTRYWRYSKKRMDELIRSGRVFQTKPGNVPREKRYLDEMPGVPLQDIWNDINPIASQAKERIGYPTQKPLALLDRIIRTSSNEGDVVLDPFCGCATACSAAEKLGRKWVGIDISPKAFDLLSMRLKREAGLDKFTKGAGVLIHRTDIPIRKGQRSPDIKDKLYGMQRGCCNLCRNWFEYRHLEVDHVIPKAKGGPDDDKNLQLLCGSCNRIKGKHTMEEAMVRLKELGIIIPPPTATTR